MDEVVLQSLQILIYTVADLEKIVLFKFLRNIRKPRAHPFKAGVLLFQQAPNYCKQAAACFELVDIYFERKISFLFFKNLVCKINLDDVCF